MEWIKCSDRLPELSLGEEGKKDLPSATVLVHVPGNKRIIAGYLTKYGWEEDTGTSCGCCSIGDVKPTHWMPLPEAPK